MTKKFIVTSVVVILLVLVGAYFIFSDNGNNNVPNETKPRYNSNMEGSFRTIVENEISKQQATEYELTLDKISVANFYDDEGDGSLFKTDGYILLTTDKELNDEDIEKLGEVVRSISINIEQEYQEEYTTNSFSSVEFEIKSSNYPPIGWRLSGGEFKYLGFEV